MEEISGLLVEMYILMFELNILRESCRDFFLKDRGCSVDLIFV